MKLDKYIDSIIDWPEQGINFKDISPLLSEPKAFKKAVHGMIDLINNDTSLLAGIESRGFIFASAMAAKLNFGLTLLRKSGKLPPPKVSNKYKLEYGFDEMEVKEANENNCKIILIDDILATGGTILSAYKLCTKAGYKISQVIVLIDLINIHHEDFCLPDGMEIDSLLQIP